MNLNKILIVCALIFMTHTINGENNVYRYVMVPKGINLRSEPNVNSKIIALIPYKTRFVANYFNKINDTIDLMEGHWILTIYENKKGWIFDAYTSNKKPIDSTTTTLNNLKQIINNVTSEKISLDGKYFEFDISPEETIKRFGHPTRIENWSGFGYFSYDKRYWIGFDDFFSGTTLSDYKTTSYSHEYKTKVLFIFPNDKFFFDDIAKLNGNKIPFYFNYHDLKWETSLEIKKIRIIFQFHDINGIIERVIVRKF